MTEDSRREAIARAIFEHDNKRRGSGIDWEREGAPRQLYLARADAVLDVLGPESRLAEVEAAARAVENDLCELAAGDGVAQLPKLQDFLIERAGMLRSVLSKEEE